VTDAANPKRKRGAPPGNQNARTHGRYSRHVSPEVMTVIQAVRSLDDPGKQVVFGVLFGYFKNVHPELFESILFQPVRKNMEQMPF
jgi:hypothetical protein